MLVLEVTNGPQRKQALKLVPGSRWAIGTSASCDLVLVDGAVAAVHARVSWGDRGVIIEDFAMTVGCLVNGEAISEAKPLRMGDHVQLGDTVLKLHEIEGNVREITVVGEVSQDLTDSEDGGILAFEAAATMVQAPLQLPKGEQTAMMPAIAAAQVDAALIKAASRLADRVRTGSDGAKVLLQRDGRVDPFWATPVSIGRERSSGIVLDDDGASLRHAVIDELGGDFFIKDPGSSNGTYVNGKRVVEAKLQSGDHIAIGRHVLVVVMGANTLGLHLGLGVLDQGSMDLKPIGRVEAAKSTPVKRKKKKASDLVWYATSDLDRGSFRARSALAALLLAVGLTGWMLASGDSKTLTGQQLSLVHESKEFVGRAESLGRDRCTACHIGAGRASSLKCIGCHPYSRPNAGHVTVNLTCEACHMEHKGAYYSSAASAALSCTSCHATPHDQLIRQKPKLVAGFSFEATADVQFHLRHQENRVACLSCHDPVHVTERRGIRGACGQCHAPDNPVATDCQHCHDVHPDREPQKMFSEVIPPTEPPRFAPQAIAWTIGLILLSFLLAALMPRRSKAMNPTPSE